MKTVLIFLSVDWEIFSRRPMLMALGVGAEKRGVKVIAVNRPLCPFTTAITKRSRISELLARPTITKVGTGLWLFSPKYFIHDQIANRSRWLTRMNIFALRRSLRWLAARADLDLDSPVIWYYHPQQGYVSRLFSDSFTVFELYDSLADIYGILKERTIAQEQKQRPEVDLLITTSPALFNQYSGNYRHAFVSSNGLTRDAFERLSSGKVRPHPELMKITSPRVGYAGVVSDRIDFDLVTAVAKRMPHVNFVFVGRQHPHNFSERFAEIRNLFFVNAVNQEEVPSVITSFDLGWLPYRDTKFFEALNPLKFYELLAAGKACISSNIPLLDTFSSEVVETCSAVPDEWVGAIQRRLTGPNSRASEAGPEIASHFLWEDLAEDLLSRVEQLWGQMLHSRTS